MTAMIWRKHRAIGDWQPPTTECYPYTITTLPKKRYVLTLSPSETVMGEWSNIREAKAFAQQHSETALHLGVEWKYKELVEVEVA